MSLKTALLAVFRFYSLYQGGKVTLRFATIGRLLGMSRVAEQEGYEMKDTAPKELGVLAVAGLFGFIAFSVSWLVLGYGLLGSGLVGVLVAAISAIVLWLGWRDAAPGPTGVRDLSGTAPTVPAATPKPAAVEPAAVAEADPAPVMQEPLATASRDDIRAAADASDADADAVDAGSVAEGGAEAAPEEEQPEILTEARAGGADDLKLIKGVGPGLEATLNELGFYHFDQIAAWTSAEIAWVDARLKFKGRIERDDWITQAKTLGAGGTTDFAEKAKGPGA